LSRSAWRASLQNCTWPELEWICTRLSWFRKNWWAIELAYQQWFVREWMRVESCFLQFMGTFKNGCLRHFAQIPWKIPEVWSRHLESCRWCTHYFAYEGMPLLKSSMITRQLILQPNICCQIDFSPKTRLHHDDGIIKTRYLLTNTQWEQTHTLITSTNPPLWASFKCCGSCMT
jgi:hypothetical protein